MRDFAFELDRRLHDFILESTVPVTGRGILDPVRRPAAVHGSAGRRNLRRPALLGTLAALTTVAASAALLSGTSAVGLPVLGVPTSNASSLKSQKTLSDAGVDFSQAHAIRTSAGTGAVLATPSGQRICLYLADGALPDGAGGSARCASTDAVERDGLLMVGQGVERPAPAPSFSSVAFILPIGATGVTISEAGRTSPPVIESGIVFAQTRHAAQLRYRAEGRAHSVALPPLFPLETTTVCNGKVRKLRDQPGATPDAPRILAPGQACR